MWTERTRVQEYLRVFSCCEVRFLPNPAHLEINGIKVRVVAGVGLEAESACDAWCFRMS